MTSVLLYYKEHFLSTFEVFIFSSYSAACSPLPYQRSQDHLNFLSIHKKNLSSSHSIFIYIYISYITVLQHSQYNILPIMMSLPQMSSQRDLLLLLDSSVTTFHDMVDFSFSRSNPLFIFLLSLYFAAMCNIKSGTLRLMLFKEVPKVSGAVQHG